MQVNLDIGYGLVPLVDERRGAPLMGRITGVRRQLSQELGFVVSQVRVRDDINMQPYAYRVVVGGVVVRSDEHTSALQSLMSSSYAVFSLQNKKIKQTSS